MYLNFAEEVAIVDVSVDARVAVIPNEVRKSNGHQTNSVNFLIPLKEEPYGR